MFEIDELLSLTAGIDFARYMDDMDIGVDTIPEARKALRDLDLALQTRQIRLNSGKTRILTEPQAYDHFKIGENLLLDKLSDRIQSKLAAKLPLAGERRKVELAVRAGLRRGTFEMGNGGKILKRLINFARQVRADISNKIFYELLTNWPSLRQSVLIWWQNSFYPESKLHLLSLLLLDGGLVDDAARMDVAIALVSARLPNNAVVVREISRITNALDHTTNWGFYTKVWILSKYGSENELMNLIETTVSLWVTQEHLSRLVAGTFPRFVKSTQREKFEAIIQRAGNAWSIQVLQFHQDLAAGTVGYTGIKNFILAKDTSLPNGISHPKFLMLLSLLANPSIAPIAVGHLKKVHATALSDGYYSLL